MEEINHNIGTLVKYSVMFDEYEFEIVGYDHALQKYQLQWQAGKGMFWVDVSDIEIFRIEEA